MTEFLDLPNDMLLLIIRHVSVYDHLTLVTVNKEFNARLTSLSMIVSNYNDYKQACVRGDTLAICRSYRKQSKYIPDTLRYTMRKACKNGHTELVTGLFYLLIRSNKCADNYHKEDIIHQCIYSCFKGGHISIGEFMFSQARKYERLTKQAIILIAMHGACDGGQVIAFNYLLLRSQILKLPIVSMLKNLIAPIYKNGNIQLHAILARYKVFTDSSDFYRAGEGMLEGGHVTMYENLITQLPLTDIINLELQHSHLAFRKGHHEIISKLVISNDFTYDDLDELKDKSQNIALLGGYHHMLDKRLAQAVKGGHIELVSDILDSHIFAIFIDEYMLTKLAVMACSKGYLNIVQRLLIKRPEYHTIKELIQAAKYSGFPEMISYLQSLTHTN